MINKYSKNIDMQDIGLFWQLTLKTLDDLRIIGNENLTLEMYVIQLVHLKNSEEKNKDETNEENIPSEKKKNSIEKTFEEKTFEINKSRTTKDQLKSINQIKSNPIKNLSSQKETSKIVITKFQDLIDLTIKEKEIELKYDLERNVKLVSFNKGKIDISFNEKLNKNFIKNLSKNCYSGLERWIISLSKIKMQEIYEQKLDNKHEMIKEFEKSETAKEIENAFPDAKLEDIKGES